MSGTRALTNLTEGLSGLGFITFSSCDLYAATTSARVFNLNTPSVIGAQQNSPSPKCYFKKLTRDSSKSIVPVQPRLVNSVKKNDFPTCNT